jgi:hypothetical protein
MSLACGIEYKMRVSYIKSPVLMYLHLESSLEFLNQISLSL